MVEDERVIRWNQGMYDGVIRTVDAEYKIGTVEQGQTLTEEELNQMLSEAMADMVNQPPHYNQFGIECIEAIKASLGDEFPAYCKGNVMKYLWRYKYKNGLEDLKKAQVYLGWMIDYTEEYNN